MKNSDLIKFRTSLLDWYHINKRNLPWRNINDPYKIWVSEIILQQTTVEQGRSYYLRFIDTFKNVFELASAPEQDVLKLWQGLGYYSRARNMHKAAQSIVSHHEGVFPDSYNEIIKLKGIGPYTAAAVLSFAFNKPYPVMDGNVIRVASRLFGIEDPIDAAPGQTTLKEKLNLIFDTENPADFNQAIMEFGAMHCKQSNPLCDDCFVQSYCAGFQNNLVALLPVKSKRVTTRQRHFIYFVPLIASGNTVFTYFKKRSEKDIWQGLYDFILFENPSPFVPKTFFKSALFINFIKSNKLSFKPLQKSMWVSLPVVHKLTHQTINTYFIVTLTPDFEMPQPFIKVKLDELNNYPLPKLVENFVKKEIQNLPQIHRLI